MDGRGPVQSSCALTMALDRSANHSAAEVRISGVGLIPPEYVPFQKPLEPGR